MTNTERAARRAAHIVHDRITAKADRPTVGGVLEKMIEETPNRDTVILNGNTIINCGKPKQVYDTLTAYQRTFKIRKIQEFHGRYITI